METQNSTTGLDKIEQLYTPRGMQGIGMPGYLRKRLGLHPSDWNNTLKTTLYTTNWNVFTIQR